MNYTQIKNELQKIALRHTNVNSFSGTDPYEELNKPNIQYSIVLCGLESAQRQDNTIQYSVILYYVDRLTRNNENTDQLKDDGIRVLQSIISQLPDDITYYNPVQYTPFEQQFSDYCGGAYCRVTLESEFEQGNCGIDDYVEELKTLYITENGIFNVTGYTYVNVTASREGITEEECREIVESYDYATKSELEEVSVEVFEGLPIKITQMQNSIMSEVEDNYAKKADIPSLDSYATEQWVNNQGFSKAVFEFDEESATLNIITA